MRNKRHELSEAIGIGSLTNKDNFMITLKKGNIKEVWIAKCCNCAAIITATTQELTVHKGDYRNDYEDFAWENCPECGKIRTLCFHKHDSSSGRDIAKELKS